MRTQFVLLFLLSAVPAAGAQYVQSQITPVSCSGTIAVGGTAQVAIPAAVAQHGFVLTNLDTTEPLWWSVVGTAAAATPGSNVLATQTASTFTSLNSGIVTPQGFGTGSAVSVVAATTGHKFTCFYW